jgi:flagellar hook-associated protein 3 FlgL
MQVDPNYISNLSSAISASTAQEQSLTSELSSGLAVATLSDNPVAASANVGLSSSLAQLDSFVESSSTTQGLLQVTDSTLGEVVTQLTSAISLATQGSNGTLNAADLKSIGNEVSGIRDTVLSLANTAYQGNFIFSGSQGSVKPFSLNLASSPATVAYNGDALASSVVTPGGQSLQVNLPGAAVFTAPGASVLDGLNQLVSDLQNGSPAAVAADANTLSSALGNVNQQRTTIEPVERDDHLRADEGNIDPVGAEQLALGRHRDRGEQPADGRDPAPGADQRGFDVEPERFVQLLKIDLVDATVL